MELQATESAGAVVRRVAASGRQDLVMVLGTGCCDSTAPYLYDRYYPGPDTVRVGEIAGVAVFAPRWLAELYGNGDGLIVDVDHDVTNDSFSLESEYDCRFTLKVSERPDRR
jgi:uncharacterized protein